MQSQCVLFTYQQRRTSTVCDAFISDVDQLSSTGYHPQTVRIKTIQKSTTTTVFERFYASFSNYQKSASMRFENCILLPLSLSYSTSTLVSKTKTSFVARQRILCSLAGALEANLFQRTKSPNQQVRSIQSRRIRQEIGSCQPKELFAQTARLCGL